MTPVQLSGFFRSILTLRVGIAPAEPIIQEIIHSQDGGFFLLHISILINGTYYLIILFEIFFLEVYPFGHPPGVDLLGPMTGNHNRLEYVHGMIEDFLE
jgi:hypothetical protein